MNPYFITASGTDIGKTLVTTTLCWQLREDGKTVTALKPVISGYNPQDMENDTARILQSCDLMPTPALMETISPWRYAAALSPDMAAAREGHPVDFDALVQFCREHAELASDIVLVEGVGGAMSPVNDRFTVLDWMTALGWPVIMVTGSYLGAISHTLTAIEAIKSKRLTVHALIVCESADSSVPLEETAATLEKFLLTDIPIVKIRRITTKEEIWKHMPSIRWLCEK